MISLRTLAASRWGVFFAHWWVAAGVVCAWVLFVLLPGDTRLAVSHPHHATIDPARSWVHIALMVVAMMVPLTWGRLRWLVVTSLWQRRHVSQALFLASYVATWSVVAVVLSGLVDLLRDPVGEVYAVGGSGVIATTWQCTSLKRRALRRCVLTRPIAAIGWQANYGCVRFGFDHAIACVTTCWALMLVVVATQHAVLVMGGIFVVGVLERVNAGGAAYNRLRLIRSWVEART